MEKIDVILWVMSGGFGLMLVMWNAVSNRIDSIESGLSKRIDGVESGLSKKIDSVESSLIKRIDGVENTLNKRIDGVESRIDKLDEKITDIDRRLCRIEGAFTTKECCVLKEDRNLRKTEGS